MYSEMTIAPVVIAYCHANSTSRALSHLPAAVTNVMTFLHDTGSLGMAEHIREQQHGTRLIQSHQ